MCAHCSVRDTCTTFLLDKPPNSKDNRSSANLFAIIMVGYLAGNQEQTYGRELRRRLFAGDQWHRS